MRYVAIGCILSKFYIKPQLCRGFIPILHSRCILSKFYIKPQLLTSYMKLSFVVVSYRNSTSNHNPMERATCCLSRVVSYRNSTSNHNTADGHECVRNVLYLIEILHQTTTAQGSKWWSKVVVSYRNSTSNHNADAIASGRATRCILSKFYIKPQLWRCVLLVLAAVVSYRNSTSNHNNARTPMASFSKLYLIEILHQTTTVFGTNCMS